MKKYNKILEAINRGIKFALDALSMILCLRGSNISENSVKTSNLIFFTPSF